MTLRGLGPGILVCGLVSACALLLQGFEVRLFGRAWLESLVIAILLGATVRALWTPGERWTPGIAFSAKFLLEVAVALLGATISAAMIADIGAAMLVGVILVVALALVVSYAVSRLFGLPHRMAMLVACGNSICGNSAIAAVAPVIGADAKDIAAAIAFTAVLGVAVVLGLPVLAVALHMTPRAFGVFAGLTVYAVPQVLAATAPISSVSAQIGMLVKLARVLMLGPVVLVLSLTARRFHGGSSSAVDRLSRKGPRIAQLVPWFIVVFLMMMAVRSFGLIPPVLSGGSARLASGLTVVSMAALGLGVEVRVVARAGLRITAAVTLSLVALAGVALGLIHVLGVA